MQIKARKKFKMESEKLMKMNLKKLHVQRKF
jgi:hypothetical protein